jgi:hypothetical protein
MGDKASKHLFGVSKAFLKLSTALSNPLPPVLRGGELFVT